MPLHARPALAADAIRIAQLLDQLGYEASTELVMRKLAALSQNSMDSVMVAQSADEIVGVVSLHVLELFHAEGRLGRITSLVVAAHSRGEGVGKLLVDAADKYFRETGCVRAEVTSGDHRAQAHVFYQAQGYEPDERRFVKRYDLPGQSAGAPTDSTQFKPQSA
jgi:N-acetylglutamate synthase-like GNAT family acetyltransferase